MWLIIHFSVGTLTNLKVAELVNVLAEFSSLSFSFVVCLYYCTSANIQQYHITTYWICFKMENLIVHHRMSIVILQQLYKQ